MLEVPHLTGSDTRPEPASATGTVRSTPFVVSSVAAAPHPVALRSVSSFVWPTPSRAWKCYGHTSPHSSSLPASRRYTSQPLPSALGSCLWRPDPPLTQSQPLAAVRCSYRSRQACGATPLVSQSTKSFGSPARRIVVRSIEALQSPRAKGVLCCIYRYRYIRTVHEIQKGRIWMPRHIALSK